jgi:hypothetical protein
MEALLHKENVKFVSTVERHEELEEVPVSHNQAGGKHDLGHVVEVPHGDEVFEAIRFAEWNGDGQNHGEAGIDRSGNEIGREDGGVPARNDGDGEVKAHHSVHRKNERRGEPRKEQVSGLIAVPMTR